MRLAQLLMLLTRVMDLEICQNHFCFGMIFGKIIAMRKQYFSLDKAINSQKTGYKRTDNAINELVDNSIQAGVENKNKHTEIVILTIEKPVLLCKIQNKFNLSN